MRTVDLTRPAGRSRPAGLAAGPDPADRAPVWRPIRPIALLLLAPLAFLTVAELARALVVLPRPWEAMYGESIIYDQAQRLLRGERLYMPFDRPPYSVAAYTPVYYWIVAALQAAVGPGFLPGRVVSLAAGLAAALMAGQVARRRAGDWWAGAFAALLFLGLGMPGVYAISDLPSPYPSWLDIAFPYYPWMALYKEDVLAVALSVGALAILAGGQSRSRLLAAGLLAALAFLTKQTTVAPALAGTVWLWRRDRRGAALFALAAGLPILATSATLELTTGAYLANTAGANANPFRREALLLNLNMLGLFQTGPIVLALLWLVARPRADRSPTDSLLALYWGGTVLPLVGLAKVGSNHNHWLELAVATSILATLALWAGAASRWRDPLACLVLGAHLCVVVPLVDLAALGGAAPSRPDPPRPDEFARLVERVRAEPGDVLANPLDVVVLAGRPILLEPYLFSIFHSQGLWSPDPILERLCSGRVGMVVSDQPLEFINPSYHEFAQWPWPVYDAVRQTMVRESVTAGRIVYVPRGDAAGSSASCGAEP